MKTVQELFCGTVDDFYCKDCGGCGFIGCDGIKTFIETHLRGKTGCSVGDIFLDEIISEIDNHKQ